MHKNTFQSPRLLSCNVLCVITQERHKCIEPPATQTKVYIFNFISAKAMLTGNTKDPPERRFTRPWWGTDLANYKHNHTTCSGSQNVGSSILTRLLFIVALLGCA
jgi:hypothetical protein